MVWFELRKSFSEYPKVICPIVFHPKNKSNHDIFFLWFDHFSWLPVHFSPFFSQGGIQQLREPNFYRFLTPNPLKVEKNGHFTQTDFTYHYY